MSEGLVTFFEYKDFGFYKRNSDYCEELDMARVLESLFEWFSTRTSIADTLPWDDQSPGYEFRTKVYLKSITKNDLTGDYLITLWRAVGDGRGVYGIRSDMSPKDAEVLNADDSVNEESVVWGEPAYYWFIPTLFIFASIKFPKSIADTELLNTYLRRFIELRSDIREKVKEVQIDAHGRSITRVHFKSTDGDDSNLWLRIYSHQLIKLTKQADLNKIASEITHFVKREVISAGTQPTKDWTRYFQGLPFVSTEVTRSSRQIQIIVDAAPTVNELKQIFETYNKNYNTASDPWSNLGFKKDGISGATVWLDQFVLRSHLAVGDKGNSGYYTPTTIFNALNLRRDILLAPFVTFANDSGKANEED